MNHFINSRGEKRARSGFLVTWTLAGADRGLRWEFPQHTSSRFDSPWTQFAIDVVVCLKNCVIIFFERKNTSFFFRKMCERFGEDVKRLISISRSSQSDDDVHREHPFDFNYRFVGEIKSAEKAHLSKCGYRRWKNLPREKWKLQIFPLYYTQPKNRRPQFRRQRCYSISRF